MMQMADCSSMENMAPHVMHHSHQGALLPEECYSNGMMNHLLMSGVGLSPMEDIACGYCQLLIHFPFIILFIAIAIRQLATLTTRISLSLAFIHICFGLGLCVLRALLRLSFLINY